MADKKEDKKTTAHFRCESFSALSIIVDDQVGARFSPYFEKFRGETRKVGYLETDDPKVISRCEDDINVESITEKEFKDATGKGSSPAPIPVG